MQDIANAPPSKVFQRAVVIEVLNDISLRDEDQLTELSETTVAPEQLKYAPRNSIIARLYASGADKSGTKDLLCYPFFPPFIALPLKQGEHVWVFSESPDIPQKVAYWMTRIAEADFVDDLNYTHGDRKFAVSADSSQDLSDIDKEPESEKKDGDEEEGEEITGEKSLILFQAHQLLTTVLLNKVTLRLLLWHNLKKKMHLRVKPKKAILSMR